MKWIISFLFGMILFCYAGDTGMSEGRTTDTYNHGLEAYRRGDHFTAFRAWSTLAKQGHAESQYNIGRMYADGIGTPGDRAEAIYWLRKAAQQGHSDAQEIIKYIGENCSKYFVGCHGKYWVACHGKYWVGCHGEYWHPCGNSSSCETARDAKIRSCETTRDAKIRSCENDRDTKIRSCENDRDTKIRRCEYANQLIN